jgi:hypothetical protein
VRRLPPLGRHAREARLDLELAQPALRAADFFAVLADILAQLVADRRVLGGRLCAWRGDLPAVALVRERFEVGLRLCQPRACAVEIAAGPVWLSFGSRNSAS